MAFSYGGDPGSNPVDEVRLLLGDTAAPGLLSNEEISYWLVKLQDTYSDNVVVAAYCADMIAARYAGEVTISADGVNYSGEQLQQKYNTLAASLRTTYRQMQEVGSGPFAGGTDRHGPWLGGGVVPLNFGVGMYDNDRAGWQREDNWHQHPYEADDVAGSWP